MPLFPVSWRNPRFAAHFFAILRHAWPVLIAQWASVGMMLIDTALLGHYQAEDLAAVAIGSGVHIAILMTLVGVVQAVSPLVAQLRGQGREEEVGAVLFHGLLLAAALAVPAALVLCFPGWLLQLAPMPPAIESKVRLYLLALALAAPASLAYRTCHAFCNGMGHPRPLMFIGLCMLAVHALLAWLLVFGHWGGAPLGVAGCALSNVICAWLSLLTVILYLRRSRLAPLVRQALRWRRPQVARLRELVTLGLPMGLSSCVEVAAFTLIALFIARLGAATVGAHRIVANLVALAYMLPLSVAVATLTRVGVAVGAGNLAEARLAARAGLGLGSLASLGLIALFAWQAVPLIASFSSAPEVQGIALSLLGYILAYQLFDTWQTIAGFCLRAYKVTAAPLLIHIFSFWGIGLGLGYWLAFLSPWANGVEGYWQAAVGSVVAAALLLLALLRWVERRREADREPV